MKKKIRDTILLPVTNFKLSRNDRVKDDFFINFWKNKEIYWKRLAKNKNGRKFILHDGPPFANGSLHLGHAFNKTIKDIILRFYSINGFYAPFIAGWDTHGLPIENILLSRSKNKEAFFFNNFEDINKFRNDCLQYTEKQIRLQQEQFSKLGLLFDIKSNVNIYKTSTNSYQAFEIEAFYKLYKNKLIYQKEKPLLWSPVLQSTIAESEIEYVTKNNKSIYLAFRLKEDENLIQKDTFLLVWTTTPWTLPANEFIVIDPKTIYIFFKCRFQKKIFIISKNNFSEVNELCFCKDSFLNHSQIKSILGSSLKENSYYHLFIKNKLNPLIIKENFILEKTGTGAVHGAPAFGIEDFRIFRKIFSKKEIFQPLLKNGSFKDDFFGLKLKNVFYQEANLLIIKYLKIKQKLFAEKNIIHNYPFEWRTKTPLIYYLTKQWFLNIKTAKELFLQQNFKIKFLQKGFKDYFYDLIKGREDWCISRQRYWGVPIPLFYQEKNKEKHYFINKKIINFLKTKFKKEGSSFWWELDFCEKMILDVWFDSGLSYWIIKKIFKKKYNLSRKADLVVEGYDQLRGWFNSSLILNLLLENNPPYKEILIHGFIIDEYGKKMSKTLGNVITIEKIISIYGIDTFRLLVSSVDYKKDIIFNEQLLSQISDSYNKIRSTFRFLLGNLFDFSPLEDKCYDFSLIDKYILLKLIDFVELAKINYKTYNFLNIYQKLMFLIINEFSAFYFDINKDYLYLKKNKSPERRAIQTVFYYIIKNLLVVIAPILVNLSEEVYFNFPWKDKINIESVHLFNWQDNKKLKQILKIKNRKSFLLKWEKVFLFKSEFTKFLEKNKNEQKISKNIPNAKLFLKVKFKKTFAILKKFLKETDFKYLLMVGRIEFVSDITAFQELKETAFVKIEVLNDYQKCLRCWKFYKKVKNDLCSSCFKIIFI